MIEWIAAATLVLIGVLHSALGEKDILKPLFAVPWAATYPRWATERILRFAWHFTTIAWFALAAVLVGTPIALAFGAVCVASAVVILVVLPGHVAWPLFLIAGLLALWTGDAIPQPVLWLGVVAGVATATVAGAFHVAWALGSTRGTANVLPRPSSTTSTTNAPSFMPPKWLTAIVAGALFAYAALAVAVTQLPPSSPARWLVVAALVVFTVRVFGDGKQVGVSKSVRDTGFARADDAYWTPLVGVLAISAAAALALGTSAV